MANQTNNSMACHVGIEGQKGINSEIGSISRCLNSVELKRFFIDLVLFKCDDEPVHSSWALHVPLRTVSVKLPNVWAPRQTQHSK